MKRTPAPTLSFHLHFVTTRTNRGRLLFRDPALSQEFLEGLRELGQKHPFGLYAYVLMPDHVHLILRPQSGSITDLVRKIKSVTARRILACLRQDKNSAVLARLRKAQAGRKHHTFQVWQQGFHTVELWSGWMVRKKIDYLHSNPVRKGLASSTKDYSCSSFRAFHGLGESSVSLDEIPLD
ncbi:MAG: transposase [Terriglobia bacterium]